MDHESFMEILFNALAPQNPDKMYFGTELAEYRRRMEKKLVLLEGRLNDEDSEAFLENLRQNYAETMSTAEKSYFTAGVQFGVQFMHTALNE